MSLAPRAPGTPEVVHPPGPRRLSDPEVHRDCAELKISRSTTSGMSARANDGPMILPILPCCEPPMVIWYHSSPFLSTPRMPMCPTWWCPQALMQPEMFTCSRPLSCARAGSAKRSESFWAMGMERVLASEQ